MRDFQGMQHADKEVKNHEVNKHEVNKMDRLAV